MARCNEQRIIRISCGVWDNAQSQSRRPATVTRGEWILNQFTPPLSLLRRYRRAPIHRLKTTFSWISAFDKIRVFESVIDTVSWNCFIIIILRRCGHRREINAQKKIAEANSGTTIINAMPYLMWLTSLAPSKCSSWNMRKVLDSYRLTGRTLIIHFLAYLAFIIFRHRYHLSLFGNSERYAVAFP